MREVGRPSVTLADEMLQVVFHHQVGDLGDEVRNEDVAFVFGPGNGRFEGGEKAIVFLRRLQGEVADVEYLVLQGGRQATDVGFAEDRAFRGTDQVGVQGQAERRTVALVEVKGIEVGVVHVHIDEETAFLTLAAQVDVAVEVHPEIGVVAQKVNLSLFAVKEAGRDDVVVIITVEGEVVETYGFHIYRETFLGCGEGQVRLSGELAELRFSEDAAQLQGLGGHVSVDLHPGGRLAQRAVERGGTQRRRAEFSVDLEIGKRAGYLCLE